MGRTKDLLKTKTQLKEFHLKEPVIKKIFCFVLEIIIVTMKSGVEMFARLRTELGQHPVVLNVVFGFLLAGVEKMLEVEFACPCNPRWNEVFVAPFFLIPGVTASVLMLMIYGHSGWKQWIGSLYPFTVWMALMMLDGQYMVCAMTDWPGTFVDDTTTYLKWCTPINTTMFSSDELMNRSHRFYILSQGIGNATITVLLVILIVYIIWRTRKKKNKDTEQPEEEAPDPASTPLKIICKGPEETQNI